MQENKIMNNLILIGMPWAGKTTIWNPLAEKLQYRFRDSDEDILKKTTHDVSHWLEQLGDDSFLEFEAMLVKEYYQYITHTVLSTWWSVVLVPESVTFLKERGKLILLDTPIESILEREASMKTERIVGMNWENPRFKNLRELFEFRRETYRKSADEIISLWNRENDDIIQEIISSQKKD
jgi:shikimate kinase